MMDLPAKTNEPWAQGDRDRVAMALLEAFTLMGQEQTDQAIHLLLDRLSRYPVKHVLVALRKCEENCRRIYLADIVENLPRPYVPLT